MSDNEIIKLINIKELEIKKLQCEVELLKKQLSKPSINKNEVSLSREEKVKIFISYFKGRDDIYPYLSIDEIKEEVMDLVNEAAAKKYDYSKLPNDL